ncbi:hypothetical protein TcCL_NonESM12639 [Trypanosoma cruzi]|nr:hypothetical protein TcCL_NonESM12639 [Trypanosoma cruzi]
MAWSVNSTAKETSIPRCTRTHQGSPESRQCVAPQYIIPLNGVPGNLEPCYYSVAALLLRTVMSPARKPTVGQSCNSLLPPGGSLDPSSIAQSERRVPRTQLYEITVRYNTTAGATRATVQSPSTQSSRNGKNS